jgi:hypothetical protein
MEPTLHTMEPLAITGVSHIEFLVSDLEASLGQISRVGLHCEPS